MKHLIALALLLAAALGIFAVTSEVGSDAHDRRVDGIVEDYTP